MSKDSLEITYKFQNNTLHVLLVELDCMKEFCEALSNADKTQPRQVLHIRLRHMEDVFVSIICQTENYIIIDSVVQRGRSETCTCIRCDKKMDNFTNKGLQPLKGLAFKTQGHYGSAYFDPMDISYLEIAVCDECVRTAENDGKVYRSNGRKL